jgi:hypothetical protein
VGAKLRGEPVARIDARSVSEGVPKRGVVCDRSGRATPRRDRIERLREARSDQRANRVALAARPPQSLKLCDQTRQFGRVEKVCEVGGVGAPWYPSGRTWRLNLPVPEPGTLARRRAHFSSLQGNSTHCIGRTMRRGAAWGEGRKRLLDSEFCRWYPTVAVGTARRELPPCRPSFPADPAPCRALLPEASSDRSATRERIRRPQLPPRRRLLPAS